MKTLCTFGFPEGVGSEIRTIAFGALARLASGFCCWRWSRGWFGLHGRRVWFWGHYGRLSVSLLLFLTLLFLTLLFQPFPLRLCPVVCRRAWSRSRPRSCGGSAISSVHVKAIAAFRWFERISCERCARTRTALACPSTSSSGTRTPWSCPCSCSRRWCNFWSN